MEKHEKANVKFFELGVKVLEVAQHAEKIYQKGSVEEKRQLLGLVFSNLTMKGEFVRTELKNPFGLIAERVKSNTISTLLDDFRTLDWVNVIKYPEATFAQVRQLLTLTTTTI